MAPEKSRREEAEVEVDRMRKELAERSGREEEEESRANEAEADRMRKEAVERCAPSCSGRPPCSFWAPPPPLRPHRSARACYFCL